MTASPVAKTKGSSRFLFRRCSSPSSFLQGRGRKRWKQHKHLIWARKIHAPNSEMGAHSPALAFVKKRMLDWTGYNAACGWLGLWRARGEVCMAQRRAACPRLTPGRSESVHNHLLRPVSLIAPHYRRACAAKYQLCNPTTLSSTCPKQPHRHPHQEPVNTAGDPVVLTTGLDCGQ